jgi:hypothetical protein
LLKDKPKTKVRSNLIFFSAKLRLPPPYDKYTSSTDIRIPAGLPPLRLKEIKKNSEAKPHIEKWAHDTRLYFLERSQWLSNEALCYFFQYEFEIDSKKWAAGCRIIQALPDIHRAQNAQP